MRLQTTIHIARPPAVVGHFLASLDNLPLWDQGVAAARSTAPDQCTVQLTSGDGNARYFRQAARQFGIEPDGSGTRLRCVAEFALRLRYLFLAPVLLLMRGAVHDDLVRLKQAIERG